jgi:hypothetical protein
VRQREKGHLKASRIKKELSLMHEIEPFYGWEKFYLAEKDPHSPFYGIQYNTQEYENTIYGYYIHPYWDNIGSETLYMKVLYADYHDGYAIFELMGEWNDTLHNDVMYLKRNVIDAFIGAGINKFILLGENVLNFHGGDDDYYQEWFEEVEDGWIAALNFREHVLQELARYHLDYYINYGGNLDIANWRTYTPAQLFNTVDKIVMRRLN